jgi:hypothetical protein
LAYPAGVVPVTEVLQGEDQNLVDRFRDLLSGKFKNSLKDSVGMPINV